MLPPPWAFTVPSTLCSTGNSGAIAWRANWDWSASQTSPDAGAVTSFPRLTAMWKRHDLMINIFQSWTQIAVFLTTDTSISRSCAAVVQVDDPDGLSLTYQYQNQPLANAMRTMHMHYGTATLRVSDDDSLTGDYYAGRDRRTFGRICRRKEQSTGSERRTYVLEIVGGKK